MVRDLLCNVEPLTSIVVLVSAPKDLSEYRVVGFLYSTRFDVPSCEVVPQDGDEALVRILQAAGSVSKTTTVKVSTRYFRGNSAATQTNNRQRAHPKMRSGWERKSVMRSSMLRGSRTKVCRVTRRGSISRRICMKAHSVTERSPSHSCAALTGKVMRERSIPGRFVTMTNGDKADEHGERRVHDWNRRKGDDVGQKTVRGMYIRGQPLRACACSLCDTLLAALPFAVRPYASWLGTHEGPTGSRVAVKDAQRERD